MKTSKRDKRGRAVCHVEVKDKDSENLELGMTDP